MIKANDLRHLRTASRDYAETEALKAEFRQYRQTRKPFSLTGTELNRVFRWKLNSQYGRQAKQRARNSESAYQAVTEAIFKIVEPDFEYECFVRLGLLVALPGIGVPVASAVLTLTEPEKYCVIDFRGWRTVFGNERSSFTINDYMRYRSEVARLASVLGWLVQEVDLAIWEYDFRRSQRRA